MSDNRHFDMTGIGHELALQVAFGRNKATHWFELSEIPAPTNFNWAKWEELYSGTISAHVKLEQPLSVKPRLVMCWADPGIKEWGVPYELYSRNRPDLRARKFPVKVNKLPGKGIDAEHVWPMIEAWLDDTSYGTQPDHDGDNDKGWRIYNEAWGHVAGLWQAFAAIEPVWLMYGK